jgi:hypothetical protein
MAYEKLTAKVEPSSYEQVLTLELGSCSQLLGPDGLFSIFGNTLKDVT